MMVTQNQYERREDIVADGTFANGHTSDAPPSYDTITTTHGGQSSGRHTHLVDQKLTSQFSSTAQSNVGIDGTTSPSRPLSNPSSRLSSSSHHSALTSNQVRQTVRTLIRNLVLNVESPDLLGSCVNACLTYHLSLSNMLQERFIEGYSPLYWTIVKNRDALLPSLLVHAAPISLSTKSEMRLACLVTANQQLFQSLRCKRGSMRNELTPLSQIDGTDAIVLGSMPADEVSIREVEGQGAFVATMRINSFQRRMRVSGVVGVEFIARGRIWGVSFTSMTTNVIGQWRVELDLLEHSSPTFVDSKLIIDLPPQSSNPLAANTSHGSDLISLTLPPDSPSLPPTPLPETDSPMSKTPQTIELRLSSMHRLAYSKSETVEEWTNDGCTYTNAIVVPLDDGPGAELLYNNTPFIAMDGALYAHLEVRLEKPVKTEDGKKECKI